MTRLSTLRGFRMDEISRVQRLARLRARLLAALCFRRQRWHSAARFDGAFLNGSWSEVITCQRDKRAAQ